MESSVYEAEYTHEMNHWWYVERRRLFKRIITSYFSTPSELRCVDIGTSTGANLTLFIELGVVERVGVEYEFRAIKLAQHKSNTPIIQGSAEAVPFVDASFDLVTCTDVLEHVLHDTAAASELQRLLRPGGYALITVPAFRILWGHQDDVSHHLRRYRMNHLKAILEDSGFQIVESFYFNWIMFVPVMAVRLLSRVVPLGLRSEGDLNNTALNKVLALLFRFDCWSSRRLHIPFGVSALILARAP